MYDLFYFFIGCVVLYCVIFYDYLLAQKACSIAFLRVIIICQLYILL